jgi:TPR repeat protein
MYNLGYLYTHWMEPPDLDAARRGYGLAVDAGDRDAMHNLGVLYAESMEPPDLDAASDWWERAADAPGSGHSWPPYGAF